MINYSVFHDHPAPEASISMEAEIEFEIAEVEILLSPTT